MALTLNNSKKIMFKHFFLQKIPKDAETKLDLVFRALWLYPVEDGGMDFYSP